MSCDGRLDAILLLSAGLLEEAEAESLRAHLQTGCAACARSAREARELDAAVLLGAPVERAPDSLRHAVLALAEPRNVATAPGAPFSRLLLAAGLGALLGGVIITMIAFPTQAEPEAVPPETIRRLGLVVGIAIPLLYLIPIALITRYRLTEERHAEIRAALDARALGSADANP